MRAIHLKRMLVQSGFEEPVYQLYKAEIALQSKRMVQTTSFIGSIMMFALSFLALFVSSIARVLPLYFSVGLVLAAIYGLVTFVPSKSSVFSVCLNYAFLLTAFVFALGLDVIQKNATATTVCVLLVALPLLVVDRPFREFFFFLAVTVCFMLESVFIKQSPKASIDVLNGISFLGVGTFLGYKHNQMVLRNLRSQRLLEQQRDTDALTNLHNKHAFERLVAASLRQSSASCAMMVIDMDNFKHVNDTYGHQAGDEILAKVGALLNAQFGQGNYVCRFGGDEFAAFVPENAPRETMQKIAEGIQSGMRQLRITADTHYRAHLCMGIALCPEDGVSFDALFRHADDTLYHIKKNGKNGFGFYDESCKEKILVVDDIEMNRAIMKKILSTQYQVLEAEDGSAALQVLQANDKITMVITDIQMPGMDGMALVQQIRAQEKYQDMAIIANTQYGDSKQETRILQLGADDFIYKAASPVMVLNRVKNVLKAKGM